MDKKLALVILNYNDNKDLFELLQLMEKQKSQYTVIIVDNDSKKENKDQIVEWMQQKDSYYIAEKKVFYSNEFEKDKEFYLVLNDRDAGFSGGNNVGFRVAHLLGIKYALLISPDVRVYEEDYLEKMITAIEHSPLAVVAGSNILDLDNQKQSPSKIISFKEELFWFLPAISRTNRLLDYHCTTELTDATIHGCCMLFDVRFLDKIGYLDEGVFMYSEEPILAARVKKAGKKILYVPEATAVHAHIRVKKINASLRMQDFIKSRKYYIKTYSNYTELQKILVYISYGVCAIAHKIKYQIDIRGTRK